jgi:hypothetical protein
MSRRPRASCAWVESERDSRIREILIQPVGWAEASRNFARIGRNLAPPRETRTLNFYYDKAKTIARGQDVLQPLSPRMHFSIGIPRIGWLRRGVQSGPEDFRRKRRRLIIVSERHADPVDLVFQAFQRLDAGQRQRLRWRIASAPR